MKKILYGFKKASSGLKKLCFNRLFLSISLLLVSTIACADSSSPAWVTTTDPIANHTDLSVAYLAQVFGTVGHTLQGTAGQFLGMIFSKLNIGILVVSALWLIFTITTICLRAAANGSFMHGNKTVMWVLLRIAIAFALLLPGPATGYNLIQDMVMKVVVEGVSLADQTWSFGLEYIANGGTLWHPPESTSETTTGSTPIVTTKQAQTIMDSGGNATTGSQPNMGLAIFLGEVCMVSSSIAHDPIPPSGGGGSGVANNGASVIDYNIVVQDTGISHDGTEDIFRYYFPGYNNSPHYVGNILNGQETASCGYVDWSTVTGANCVTTNTTSNAGTSSANHCAVAKAAVTQMVYGLLPAAKQFACNNYPAAGHALVCQGLDEKPATMTTNIENAGFNSLINYVNAVTPVAQSQAMPAKQGGATPQEAASFTNGQGALSFIGSATKGGWLTAGRYYWDLSQVQAHLAAITNIGNYTARVEPIGGGGNPPSEIDKVLTSAKTSWAPYMNNTQKGNNSQGILAQLAAYSSTSGAGDTGNIPHVNAASLGVNVYLNLVLGPVVHDIIQLFSYFAVGSSDSLGLGYNGIGSDPIMFLHNVGMSCMAVAADIWITLALTLFGIGLVTAVCQSVYNANTPVSGITDWMKPPLLVLAGALLSVGVLLGYFVPIYPFALFTFGVIGWIITVMEAMVAAPLIAFGLTHPEGHDFLGGAKQGLMLLLGVFLRPTLMVVGLIGGMILSYVSLRILVYTYSGFLTDLFWTLLPEQGAISPGSVLAGAAAITGNLHVEAMENVSLGQLVMFLFAFPMFLGVFASLVYVVTTQCFSLIYVLPDYILRWIGGPQHSNNSAQMMNQLQGHTSSMGKTGGDYIHGRMKGALDAKSKKDEANASGKNKHVVGN